MMSIYQSKERERKKGGRERGGEREKEGEGRERKGGREGGGRGKRREVRGGSSRTVEGGPLRPFSIFPFF